MTEWYKFTGVIFLVSDKWSPALQIRTVLLSIQALLSAPNPDDPLANDVAEQWKVNESQAIHTGRNYNLDLDELEISVKIDFCCSMNFGSKEIVCSDKS